MFALSFAVFSIPASAEVVEQDYNVVSELYFYRGANALTPSMHIKYNHSTALGTSNWLGDLVFTEDNYFLSDLVVTTPNNGILVSSGKTAKVNVSNVYRVYTNEDTGVHYYWKGYDSIQLILVGKDGSYYYLDNCEFTYNSNTFKHSYSVEFMPDDDIVKFIFRVKHTPTIRYGISGTFESDVYVLSGTDPDLTIDIQSEEAGLLSGLLQWVKDLYNKVTDGFTEIISNVSDIFSSLGNWFQELWIKFENLLNKISQLPALIWEKIETGFQYLFIPAEGDWNELWTDIESDLKDRLGVVYEIGEVIFDIGDAVYESGTRKNITMPETTIQLPNNNSFTFGGWTVKIIPDGDFDLLIESVKTIISVIATLAFVNGMVHKYDEVMGVEK